MHSFWCLFVFGLYQIRGSLGCAGYILNVTKLEPCGENNVVTLSDDFGVVLDKDCNIYMKGCLQVTKRFETVSIKYTLNKQPLPPMEGVIDLCEMVDKYRAEARELIEKLGFPDKCPIEKMDICGSPEKSFNIAKYKGYLGMAKGHSDIKLEADHGDVGKTCIDIGSEISKPREKKNNKT